MDFALERSETKPSSRLKPQRTRSCVQQPLALQIFLGRGWGCDGLYAGAPLALPMSALRISLLNSG